MKTAVRRVLLMSALMSPTALYALGLGEIRLNSALNQPFDADIELVSAADEDLSALRASLAASDTFVRYGLDKPAYLSDFSFRVVRGADGRDVLKVTSPRPVTEPFVTLLVEATWPRGKLLREYTVLLDPPVYAPTPAAAEAPVAAPRATASAPARAAPAAPTADVEPFAAAPAPSPAAQTRPRSAAPAVAAPSLAAGSTYRVRRNDTLWNIASNAYPGTRADVNRAMVAIYQANPQAFDGNINLLRAGSLLTIPSASDVSAISSSAASDEVARQYRMWREGSPAQPGAAVEAGRLKLVTPEQGTPAASTATTAAPAPAAPAGPAPTDDLQQRVQQLEAELAEARRLLEVRSAELSTLQGQEVPAEPAEAPAAEPPAVAEPGEAAPPAEGAPEAKVAPAPAPGAEPEPATKPPAAVEEPGPTLLERIGSYWWALLALLIAALAYLFYRRSRGAEGASEAELHEALARTRTDLRARQAAVAATAAAARPREADIVVEERRAHEPSAATAPTPRAPEPSRRPVSIDDTLSGEGPTSIEPSDPLAEADFHMAYGLYDQAADLVQLAARREPKRRDLRLKLLEIFFVWGNRDRFLELARDMHASRSEAQAGEWDKIMIMGKQLAPDDALFAGTLRPSDAGLDMELHETHSALDMDLGLGAGAEPDLDLTAGGPPLPAGASLDFVIDEPVRGTEDTAVLEPTVEAPRARQPGTEEPTQEVPLVDLGLEVGEHESLDDLTGAEDLLTSRFRPITEDTIERARPARTTEPEGEDLLSATGILRDQTAILPGLDDETVQMDLPDQTGELPTLEAAGMPAGSISEVDFPLEVSTTLSEVGTKLDLARAYIDMGDPEGARSILDEVLKEGTATQKQEAERLVASLP